MQPPEAALPLSEVLARIDAERPVLLAGPTASGKSALAMEIAAQTGGAIVNADALQVFADWRVLTARPTTADEAALPHRLYGHVPGERRYSVGAWLRDVAPLLGGRPPVIVGGTGLYFSALTEGLAAIPEIDPDVRREAATRPVERLIEALDPGTRNRIDLANPARVRRAWEVLTATGRGLAEWQDTTPAPMVPLAEAQPLLVSAPKDWLAPRIARRVDAMIASGALEEARRHRTAFHPDRPSSKAIGAAELVAHLAGEISLDEARARIALQTARYAKRQRTWFRSRMRAWTVVAVT